LAPFASNRSLALSIACLPGKPRKNEPISMAAANHQTLLSKVQ
jgi:hypothetical protein